MLSNFVWFVFPAPNDIFKSRVNDTNFRYDNFCMSGLILALFVLMQLRISFL